MAERVVLDAHALLAFLQDEAGARAVSGVLRRGEPWMTLVNLGEVAYIIERGRGAAEADLVCQNLLARERPDGGVAIRWLPVDQHLMRRAATVKAGGGLSYADAYAVAAAQILDCPVMTGDPEFAAAERAGVPVRWL